MAKFFHQPNSSPPRPAFIRYVKPSHDETVLHYEVTGIRWGFDEWGNGPAWLLDGREVDKGWDGPILMSGVREWREG